MDSGGQNRSPGTLPPSLGPGAQPVQSGLTPESMVRQIVEMRKQYRLNVESSSLTASYVVNGVRRHYEISFSSAPLSGFRQWLTYGGAVRSNVSGTFLLDMMRGAENMIGRRLTQQEAEAFLFHSAKRMQYGFMGMGIALGAGYAMAARGAPVMKFPFKKPKPLDNYDAFPLKRAPLLTGQFARYAWQVTRANIYAALGIIFLSPVFRSMGESVMAVGLYNDERTRNTVKAIKGGFDRIRMNRTLPGSSSAQPQTENQTRDEPDQEQIYGESSDERSSHENSADYSGDLSFSDGATDSRVAYSSGVDEREISKPRVHPGNEGFGQDSSTSVYQSKGRVESERSKVDSSHDFFFDDASPIAANNTDASDRQPQTQPQSRGGGSVWARIRRSSQGSQAPSTWNPTSQVSPQVEEPEETRGWRRPISSNASANNELKTDSFSFSNSDSNRALAKEQAQKDFDDMLERERRESGSGDYDKGSLAAGSYNEAATQSKDKSVWSQRRRGN